ncbi:MAG TPA: class I SAM-dependent methyltransferase, partial [Terriglobales bacterium]|nr:class I SAM-dependent methyltransferase [Terriglobales bacterium]
MSQPPSATGPQSSFRDPGGRLISINGHILRLVRQAAAPDLEAFLSTPLAKKLISEGKLVGSVPLDRGQAALVAGSELLLRDAEPALILEHERIPFPSFPYQWPPEMLHAAAVLTLELAAALLDHGFGLKDATPYNILFRGTRPVFIDVLSIERRDPKDARWLPYAQFVRTFLLPLLVNQRFGIPLEHLLISRRDGLEPEEVYQIAGPMQRLAAPFLTLVSLPTWLGRRHDQDDTSLYQKKLLNDPERAAFVLRSGLKRLRRDLARVAPGPSRHSRWSQYMVSNHHYSEEELAAKESFVREALAEFRPRTVLDAGCNTGHFSCLAAQAGASVVALDSDPVVAGMAWRRAHEQALDVLPLVVNLGRPSPGIGWRNRECPAFLEQAQGAFDAVLMLALVHHLVVSERIPLEEILDLAAEMTRDLLIIEYVSSEDPMFRRLTRGREELHRDFTQAYFEAVCARHFDTVRKQ